MTREEKLNVGAEALRVHTLKGRFTTPWDKLPKSQKSGWIAKARVVLDAGDHDYK